MTGKRRPKELHVEQVEGGWVVRSLDSSEGTTTFSTQKEAWAHAKQKSQTDRADAFLHRRDGSIRDRINGRNYPSFIDSLLSPFTLGLLGLILIAGVLVAITDSGRKDGKSTDADSGYDSVAQGLAIIDAAAFVSPDDQLVSDYQTALDQLRSSVCALSETRIADMAVSVRDRIVPATTTLRVLQEAVTLSGIASNHAAMAISLGLPDPPDSNGQCALYFTGALLELDD